MPSLMQYIILRLKRRIKRAEKRDLVKRGKKKRHSGTPTAGYLLCKGLEPVGVLLLSPARTPSPPSPLSEPSPLTAEAGPKYEKDPTLNLVKPEREAIELEASARNGRPVDDRTKKRRQQASGYLKPMLSSPGRKLKP
ncbi:unnamed protein product [Victoria cruziana]